MDSTTAKPTSQPTRPKLRLYQILETALPGDRPSRWFDIFIVSLIIGTAVAIILETVPALHERGQAFFFGFEVFSVAIFTVEYLSRLWVCTEDPRFSRPIVGRLRYMVTPLALIDALAIIPFYLPFLGLNLLHVRLLRLLRLGRLLKLGRYSDVLQLLGKVMSAKREELIVTAAIMGILLLISSSLIYYAEHAAQPEVFSSIPASMWWGVATLTTVGYGDAYPITAMGRLLASVTAVLGIGMFALPTGILSSAFMAELEEARAEKARKQAAAEEVATCPHCGKRLKDEA